jgi:hypothetical protein
VIRDGRPPTSTVVPDEEEQHVIHRCLHRLHRRLPLRHERGDVPGWVLITIMTAGIVAVLWQFAQPYLRDILEQALEAVAP